MFCPSKQHSAGSVAAAVFPVTVYFPRGQTTFALTCVLPAQITPVAQTAVCQAFKTHVEVLCISYTC